MENIKLTDLEKKVLNEIIDELDCGWSEREDGEFNCIYNPFIKNTTNEVKGVLSSLVKKEIINICSCESKNDVICVNLDLLNNVEVK